MAMGYMTEIEKAINVLNKLWQENKDNQDLYNACTLGINALKEQSERDNLQHNCIFCYSDTKHNPFISGYNYCPMCGRKLSAECVNKIEAADLIEQLTKELKWIKDSDADKEKSSMNNYSRARAAEAEVKRLTNELERLKISMEDCSEFKPAKQTNADRIRAMSDEELQKFLLEFEVGDIDYAKTFCDLCCENAALEQKSTDCDGCLLWWLQNDSDQPQGLNYWKQEERHEH